MARQIKEVIVHCAATRSMWMADQPIEAKVAEIRKWHKERGWSDIGYHWVVDRDGSVMAGRDEARQGAHCKGKNKHSIGVCLIGGHGSSSTDQFLDNFTAAQDTALGALLFKIKKRHPTAVKISGHNEYSNKACPGFNVRAWLERRQQTKKPRTKPVQSTTVQASATQIAAGAGTAVTAVSALSGTAQLVALGFAGVIVLAGLWIMKERLRHWARGVR